MFSPSLRKHKHWSLSVPALESSSVLGAFESYKYPQSSIYFADDNLSLIFLAGADLSASSLEALVVKIEKCFTIAKTVGIVYLDEAAPNTPSWTELQVKLFNSFKGKPLSTTPTVPTCLRLSEPENLASLLETFLLERRKTQKMLAKSATASEASLKPSRAAEAFELLASATTRGNIKEHNAFVLSDGFGSLKEFAQAAVAGGWEKLEFVLDTMAPEEKEEADGIAEFWEHDWEDE